MSSFFHRLYGPQKCLYLVKKSRIWFYSLGSCGQIICNLVSCLHGWGGLTTIQSPVISTNSPNLTSGRKGWVRCLINSVLKQLNASIVLSVNSQN